MLLFVVSRTSLTVFLSLSFFKFPVSLLFSCLLPHCHVLFCISSYLSSFPPCCFPHVRAALITFHTDIRSKHMYTYLDHILDYTHICLPFSHPKTHTPSHTCCSADMQTDTHTHYPHSSGRGVTALICHALSLPFITGTIIQHTSNVISLQLEIHQAQGAFNCLVGAALPKPPPFSLPTLCFTSL